jgi:sugar/nucleoside kinase (ribokinase family)
VIVVVGSPLVGVTDAGLRAAGMAAGIARAAAAAGAEVQVVGKVGEDPGGEAVLLDLATALVGHVAILRDPSRPTPAALPAPHDDLPLFEEADAEPVASDDDETATTRGLSLEPADIELALRYLPDYRVLVIAEPLPDASLRVALAAAGWNGAALVVIVLAGSTQPAAGDDATVIEAPADDPDDAFAGIVGAYAAAIDRGEEPAEAFATASSSLGASAVAD